MHKKTNKKNAKLSSIGEDNKSNNFRITLSVFLSPY